MTEPLYEKIEFCRKTETLWGKLESGKWDWLGVHPDGQFVLGYPVVGGRMFGKIHAIADHGGHERRHGVRIRAPLSSSSDSWFPTEEAARADFEMRVGEYRKLGESRPRVVRLQLVVDGRVVATEHVVTRPSTFH